MSNSFKINHMLVKKVKASNLPFKLKISPEQEIGGCVCGWMTVCPKGVLQDNYLTHLSEARSTVKV